MPEAAPRSSDDRSPSDRPIIAFFDVDNTLMRGASVFHVGRGAFRRGLLGIRDIARFAWHDFRFVKVGENRAHLATARERALELVAGHSEAEVIALAEDIYDRNILPRLWPETVDLTREHLAKGHEVWLISATPQLVGQVIADRLGLTGALGTVLEAEQGRFTGQLIGNVVHAEEKAVVAEDLARERGVNLADCWAYSDSTNDIPLLSMVGNRVVVNPDARLERHAREHGWAIMPLKHASIREAQRRVRREARAVKKSARRTK
jgi:HAD superfamily hydrolase (TIGR01490 family)